MTRLTDDVGTDSSGYVWRFAFGRSVLSGKNDIFGIKRTTASDTLVSAIFIERGIGALLGLPGFDDVSFCAETFLQCSSLPICRALSWVLYRALYFVFVFVLVRLILKLLARVLA